MQKPAKVQILKTRLDSFTSSTDIITEIRNDHVEKVTTLSSQSMIVKAGRIPCDRKCLKSYQGTSTALHSGILTTHWPMEQKWGRTESCLCPACKNLNLKVEIVIITIIIIIIIVIIIINNNKNNSNNYDNNNK